MKKTKKKVPSILSEKQSREDNKKAFIKRLKAAGWSQKEAAEEYEREV